MVVAKQVIAARVMLHVTTARTVLNIRYLSESLP